MKKNWAILKATFNEFSEDNVLRLSAALAYYAMFSLGPLLVLVVGLAGLAFGHARVRHQIEGQLQSMVGPGATKTISSMMTNNQAVFAGKESNTNSAGTNAVVGTSGGSTNTGTLKSAPAVQKHRSLIATIVGLVALLFGAGGVFGALQDSLNTIWEVKSKPGAGIWALLRARFLSFSMVLGTGFLLLVSLALTTFLSAVTGSFGHKLPIPEAVAHGLNFIVSFGVITALFGMIFKYLPDVKVPFRKVWVGAIGTAFLFTIGKYLLALYLGRASTTSSYGAAGSVIVILMWVYYASVILFFGAEFTQVYARLTGAPVRPRRYAVPVTEHERAEQGIPKEHGGRKPSPSRGPEPGLQGAAFAASPGATVRRKPWQFLGLMLVAGFAGGIVMRFRALRTALRLYAAARKVDLR